jgi:hypothetical protein
MRLQEGPIPADVQWRFPEPRWLHDGGARAVVRASRATTGSVAHPLPAADRGRVIRPGGAPRPASSRRGWLRGCPLVCS